jgi:hypothetical protein
MVHVISSLRAATHPVSIVPKPPAKALGDTSSASGATDFRALFTPNPASAAAPPFTPAPNPTPTAESVFGPTPWLTNPTGVGPNGSYAYNPFYFASPQTAAKVAQMVGGKVVESNQFTGTGGVFAQQQPNQMVQLPDGRIINPGLVASFYTHGYPQSYVDMMVASEVKNA